MLMGLFSEAAHAQHVTSWLHAGANDTERARLATLRAEQISRTADVATRCQQLANTGRCLLEVDSSGPQAMALITEAGVLAEAHNLHFVELEWGRALAARWHGKLEEAAALTARAIAFARMREDRWREAECLARLASITLERGELDDAEVHCSELRGLTARMGVAGLPFAASLQALVQLARHAPNAPASVRATVSELRAIDDKARLAYVLNTSASYLLDAGDQLGAREAAAEGAMLAREVRHPTEIAVGEALLACIAVAAGDRSAGAAHLAAALAADNARAPSARTRQYCELAAAALASGIPTLVKMDAP